jgi:lysyl-tRNA synthetase class 2
MDNHALAARHFERGWFTQSLKYALYRYKNIQIGTIALWVRSNSVTSEEGTEKSLETSPRLTYSIEASLKGLCWHHAVDFSRMSSLRFILCFIKGFCSLVMMLSQTHSLPTEDTATSSHRLRETRLEKAHKLRTLGVEPYPWKFSPTHSLQTLQTLYAELPAGEERPEDLVCVAGRVMAMRNSGLFIDLHDSEAKIQIFSHKENLSEDNLQLLKHVDSGDFLGVEGSIRRTSRGELSVKALKLVVLSKALLPLPEKYHGLTDVETRYRQRYLDFATNPESRDKIRKRSTIVRAIRDYLDGQGLLEVDTPMLQPLYGGAAAKPFVTHHNTLDMSLYLRIAPELYLKRLIAGQVSEGVYEINKNFRNEGISPRHNPEFTALEVYQAYADYEDMLTLTEHLVAHCALKVHGSTQVTFGETLLDFTPPWRRMTMLEAVQQFGEIDFNALDSDEAARRACHEKGVHVKASDTWGHCLLAAFEAFVEPQLEQPTHILDYPVDVSPLSKKHRNGDARFVERFESFANTWEIANAFSELTDPVDQRERFEAQLKQHEAGDEEAHTLDEDYLVCMEHGLPPTGGMGLGVDRLVMLLTDSHSIREVIAFPTMKMLS